MATEQLSPARMEAFSDGVIAVIITIMVLELKVPGVHEMGNAEAIRFDLKMLLIYLLSFIQTGIYWVNHHYLIDDLEDVTHGILWANLALLFCLSLIPFGTEWIGIRGIEPLPVAVYVVCFVLPGIVWMVLSAVIRQRTGIVPVNGRIKQTFSVVMDLGAIPVAFWQPWVALAMIASVALVWLIPPRKIVEKTRRTPSPHQTR